MWTSRYAASTQLAALAQQFVQENTEARMVVAARLDEYTQELSALRNVDEQLAQRIEALPTPPEINLSILRRCASSF